MEEYHINFYNLDDSVKEAIRETLQSDQQFVVDELEEYENFF